LKKNKLIIILGPTAVGKTALATKLAYYFNGEIISADSRQVYKKMNLGTGKDYEDYIVNGIKIPYHLIDIIEPAEEFNLFEFVKRFIAAFENITARGKHPFLVGGTGLYLDAVVKRYKLTPVDFSKEYENLNSLSMEELREMLLGFNPSPHNSTDLTVKERLIRAIIVAKNKDATPLKFPDFKEFIIGVFLEKDELKNRIKTRLKKRLEAGLVEEVQGLLDEGLTFEKLFFFGLEYRYVASYLKNEISYSEMFEKLSRAIYKFAKRQMTWYRKMEREGATIRWLRSNEVDKATDFIKEFISDEF